MAKEISPKLLKHFKKVTSKQSSRPALQCIFYGEDGSLSATDSHRLIHIKNFHNYETPVLQNPETLEILTDVNYPRVDRMIPEMNEDTFQMKIDANELKLALKAVKEPKLGTVRMDFKGDCIELRSGIKENSIVVRVDAKASNQSFETISFNGSYLNDALMFCTDLIPRLNDKIVTFYFDKSPIRPFTVMAGNVDYIYICTPIRTH